MFYGFFSQYKISLKSISLDKVKKKRNIISYKASLSLSKIKFTVSNNFMKYCLKPFKSTINCIKCSRSVVPCTVTETNSKFHKSYKNVKVLRDQ